MSGLSPFEQISTLMAEAAVPGLSLAYISSKNPEPTRRVWGVASTADGRLVNPGTLFRAASLSKPVTALTAIRLAKNGDLDLDADVNSLLKSWQLPLAGCWKPVVTMRMLLAHVAGTSGWGDNAGYDGKEPPPSLVDVLAGRGDTPALTFHTLPNVMWNYSSGGYHVVQLVLSDVTGIPFNELVRELVLGPLEMSSTTFQWPLPAEYEPLASDAHVDGRPQRVWGLKDPAVAAQGMWTTPSDLMRLAAAVNDRAAPEMLLGHPVEPRMGLGLFLNESAGTQWWSHGGSAPGFESLIAGVADAGFAVAVMTNASAGGAMVNKVAALVAEKNGPVPMTLHHLTWEGISAAIRMNKHNLSAVGTYRLPSGLTIEISASPPDKWDQRALDVTLPGQPRVALAPPFADGHWRVPGFEAVLVYEPPDSIRLLQAGREVRAGRAHERPPAV